MTLLGINISLPKNHFLKLKELRFSLRQREELKLSLMCCPVTDFTAIYHSLERPSGRVEVGNLFYRLGMPKGDSNVECEKDDLKKLENGER